MIRVVEKVRTAVGNESGFTTAELLGNAALGVLALVVIWKLMGGLGATVVDFIKNQITGQ